MDDRDEEDDGDDDDEDDDEEEEDVGGNMNVVGTDHQHHQHQMDGTVKHELTQMHPSAAAAML